MAEGDGSSQQLAGTQGNDEVPGQVLTQFCQPCSNNSKETAAVVFCPTCNEFQCKECSSGHNMYSFMKNHKLIDVSAASENIVVYDMSGLDRCEKHDKPVEFFCHDDKKLCCSTCAISEHRKCNVLDEIKDAYAKERNIDFALKVKLMEEVEWCRAEAKHWTDSEQHIKEQVNYLFRRFSSVRTNLNKRLDKLEEDMNAQMASLSEMKTREYRNKRAQSEEVLKILENDLKVLDMVKLQGTPEQLFIAQQRLNESLATRKENSSNSPKLETMEISLEICNELTQILDTNIKLGSVKVNTSEIQIDDIVKGRRVVLEKIVSIAVEPSKDDAKEPLITGMDFLPDGRLVFADNMNNKCLVYNDKLEQLGFCKLPDVPQSLTTLTDEEIAVTFGGKMYIAILHVSRTNEITRTRTIKTSLNYDSISMKDEENFIVGTFEETKPVHMVSLTGKERDFNTDFPSKKFSLRSSFCVCVKKSNKVVLIDKDEHTVYIYDVKANTSVVVKDDRIRKPTCVAVGPYGSIFVCSSKTGSFVQISQAGRILSSYKLDMRLPFRVCVSQDKTKLAVTNNTRSAVGQRKLQLFNIKL